MLLALLSPADTALTSPILVRISSLKPSVPFARPSSSSTPRANLRASAQSSSSARKTPPRRSPCTMAASSTEVGNKSLSFISSLPHLQLHLKFREMVGRNESPLLWIWDDGFFGRKLRRTVERRGSTCSESRFVHLTVHIRMHSIAGVAYPPSAMVRTASGSPLRPLTTPRVVRFAARSRFRILCERS